MRAFLQERSHQRKNGQAVGPTILYFGSRHQSKDFIYEGSDTHSHCLDYSYANLIRTLDCTVAYFLCILDEVMNYTRDGTLSEVHLAFSRGILSDFSYSLCLLDVVYIE